MKQVTALFTFFFICLSPLLSASQLASSNLIPVEVQTPKKCCPPPSKAQLITWTLANVVLLTAGVVGAYYYIESDLPVAQYVIGISGGLILGSYIMNGIGWEKFRRAKLREARLAPGQRTDIEAQGQNEGED